MPHRKKQYPVFDSPDTMSRVLRDALMIESQNLSPEPAGQNTERPGRVALRVAVEVLAAYNEQAKGWPAKIVYKNLNKESGGSPDYLDGNKVIAYDLNGEDLAVGQRYAGWVQGVGTWTPSGAEQPVRSMFVEVNAGGSSTSPDCTPLGHIDSSDCLTFQTANPQGRCSTVAAGQSTSGVSAGSGQPWIGEGTFTTPTGTFTPTYQAATEDHPQGRLSLTGVGGSASGGATVWGIPQGCRTVADASYAVFSFGGTTLCDGEPDECGANYFEVIVRCGGPGCLVTPVCCDEPVKRRLCVTFSNGTGMLSGVTGSWVVPYVPDTTFPDQGSWLRDIGAGGFGEGTIPLAACEHSGEPDYTGGEIDTVRITPCITSSGDWFWVVTLEGFASPEPVNTIAPFAAQGTVEHPEGDCSLPVSGTISGGITGLGECVGTVDFTISDGACDDPTADPDDPTDPATTFDCDGNGNCADPGDGSGTYETLAECAAACCNPTPGQTVELLIQDGTDAGTYSATWVQDGLYAWHATFTIDGDTYTVRLSGGLFQFWSLAGPSTSTGGAADCGTSSVAFIPATYEGDPTTLDLVFSW